MKWSSILSAKPSNRQTRKILVLKWTTAATSFLVRTKQLAKCYWNNQLLHCFEMSEISSWQNCERNVTFRLLVIQVMAVDVKIFSKDSFFTWSSQHLAYLMAKPLAAAALSTELMRVRISTHRLSVRWVQSRTICTEPCCVLCASAREWTRSGNTGISGSIEDSQTPSSRQF